MEKHYFPSVKAKSETVAELKPDFMQTAKRLDVGWSLHFHCNSNMEAAGGLSCPTKLLSANQRAVTEFTFKSMKSSKFICLI